MILAGGAGLNKGGSATSDAKTLNRLLSLIGGMAGEVAADTRVGHLFDTAGVTEFVMTVEEQFGITIPDEVLWPDLLDASIEEFAAYIDGRLPRPLTPPSAGVFDLTSLALLLL